MEVLSETTAIWIMKTDAVISAKLKRDGNVILPQTEIQVSVIRMYLQRQ